MQATVNLKPSLNCKL